MKRALLIVAVLLAGCSKAAAHDDNAAQQQQQLQKIFLNAGFSPEDAGKMALQAQGMKPTDADKKRAAAHEAQREQTDAEILAGACKNDPGISYC